MGAPLNNLTAPDEYDEASLLSCPGTIVVRFFVFNQAIYWKRGMLGKGGQGIQWRPEEEFLAPGNYEFPDLCDAIAIRAAIPKANLPPEKNAAQVTIWTRTKAELS